MAVLLWGAGGRRKLWDLDLSKLSKHQTEQIWGLRFSPDETKVAIGFGSSWKSDPSPRHVVVVAIDHPQVVLHEFELKTKLSPYPFGDSLIWSPSGTILVATQTRAMLRLDGRAPCEFPADSGFRGFLSEDRMVIVLRRPDLPEEPTEVRILRPDCSLADSWKTKPLASVLNTTPEQDLLAIGVPLKLPEHSVIELVVSRTHEVKQHWIWDSGSAFFPNQGNLVCSGNLREGRPLPDVACWDTQTGAKTAENDKVGVDLVGGIESAGGDLLAITDYKYISLPWKSLWEFLDLGSEAVVPRRRLIWDVRTGKERADWGVLQQKELWGKDLNGARMVKTNFVVSLSPTGKYLAEGGSGSVSVYAVQP
jgi:hypothetical protein